MRRVTLFRTLLRRFSNAKDVITYAAHGELSKIISMFNRGIDIKDHQEDAMIAAAINGRVRIINYLVAKGVCPRNYKSYYDSSSYETKDTNRYRIRKDYYLMAAADRGHLNVIQCLEGHGCDIRVERDYLLYTSSILGYFDIVKFMTSRVPYDKEFGDKLLAAHSNAKDFGHHKIAAHILEIFEKKENDLQK